MARHDAALRPAAAAALPRRTEPDHAACAGLTRLAGGCRAGGRLQTAAVRLKRRQMRAAELGSQVAGSPSKPRCPAYGAAASIRIPFTRKPREGAPREAASASRVRSLLALASRSLADGQGCKRLSRLQVRPEGIAARYSSSCPVLDRQRAPPLTPSYAPAVHSVNDAFIIQALTARRWDRRLGARLLIKPSPCRFINPARTCANKARLRSSRA